MATPVTLNGVSFSLPSTGDDAWGSEVSNYLIALATGVLSKAGGSFTLTAAADFGANFGLKSISYSSRGTVSSAGVLRLANAESVGWRNEDNSADKLLKVNASDQLEFDGSPIVSLALGTANYVLKMNTGGTAYEWGALANANIDAAAAIALSKLATVTASRALVSDGSGLISASSVTATELGYVSGVTSAIQTQLDACATDTDLSTHESDTSTHGVGEIVGTTEAQTLTQKTLTSPDINGGTADSLTSLSLRDSGAAQDLVIQATSSDTPSATRTLTIDMQDENTELELHIDRFAVSGAAALGLDLIANNSAQATFPGGAYTLATLTSTQTLEAKTLDAAAVGGATNDGTDGFLQFKDQSADAATPGSGTDHVNLFAKDKKLYTAIDNGSGTAIVQEVGSGAGGGGAKNYITNPSADIDTTGWTVLGDFDDTIVRHTTAADLPRATTTGTGFNFTSTGADDYVYTDFTLDATDLTRKIGLEVSYASATDNFRVEVWQNTASDYSGTWAELNLHTDDSSGDSYLPATTGTFHSSFDTQGEAYIQVRVVHGDSGTDTLYFSDVLVSPDKVAVPGAIDQYLGSISGFTVSNNGSKAFTISNKSWRKGNRLLSQLVLNGDATASGSALSTIFTLNMPSGYTIDTSALADTSTVDNNTAGYATVIGFGGASVWAPSEGVVASSTTIKFREAEGATAFVRIADMNVSVDMDIHFVLDVPIAEWAGSGTVNVAQNDVEYAYNSSTTTSANTTAFAYGPTGALIQNFAPAGTSNVAKLVRFQTPIQATDEIVFEVNDGSGWVTFSDRISTFHTNDAGTTYYGAKLIRQAAQTDVSVAFFSKPEAVNAWSAFNTYRWRLKKVSSGQAVGFGAATQDSLGLIKPSHTDLSTSTTSGVNLVRSGTYTPTSAALTNLDSAPTVSANSMTWIQVGNVVHCSGYLLVDPTAANVSTTWTLTLPVPPTSNFSSARDLTGVGAMVTSGNGEYNTIITDATSGAKTAKFTVGAVNATINRPTTYTFQYTTN